MNNQKAVIFDMDGVIIDSERLWKQAEWEVFSSLGVDVSDEHALLTQSMTTGEVTQFWFSKFPWQTASVEAVEQMVISRVMRLIETEDCRIHGVNDLLQQLKSEGYRIGLATNSPYCIIPTVLKKIEAGPFFDAISSAEFEEKGKPDPAVYLSTATKLGVKADDCIAIEDSHSGMKAAKSAGMTVVGFTNGNPFLHFEYADYTIDRLIDFSTGISTSF